METKIYKRDVVEAAKTIRRGGLVAVPTETVYGLAGNGLDAEAVEKIYEVKGRPAVKPLSLMVPDESAMGLPMDWKKMPVGMMSPSRHTVHRKRRKHRTAN